MSENDTRRVTSEKVSPEHSNAAGMRINTLASSVGLTVAALDAFFPEPAAATPLEAQPYQNGEIEQPQTTPEQTALEPSVIDQAPDVSVSHQSVFEERHPDSIAMEQDANEQLDRLYAEMAATQATQRLTQTDVDLAA